MPEDLFRPQLGEPHHSAYVVEDIETTVSRLVDQLGAGPFFLIEKVPLENVLSRGEPAEFVHDSSFRLRSPLDARTRPRRSSSRPYASLRRAKKQRRDVPRAGKCAGQCACAARRAKRE